MEQLTVEQFEALSRNEKAVLVAKDILERIRLSKIKAKRGMYCVLDLNEVGGSSDRDVRSNLSSIKQCQVCALGAAMLSTTVFANKLTFKQLERFDGDRDALNVLETVFTPKQMLLIETAFESYSGFRSTEFIDEDFEYLDPSSRIGAEVFNEVLTREEVIACINFYNKYSIDDDRLIAICDNIIENGGIFTL